MAGSSAGNKEDIEEVFRTPESGSDSETPRRTSRNLQRVNYNYTKRRSVKRSMTPPETETQAGKAPG